MSISTSNIFNTTGIRIKKDAFVVMVLTEWNEAIVNELEKGAIEVLQNQQVRFEIVNVPGAIEIPFAINNYWAKHKKGKKKPSAFIALGCVIKGDTPHFDYVCQSVTSGITQLNILLPVPVIFGVLTVLNEQQAYDRLGGEHGHKGKEAAATAIKMIALAK